MNNPALKLAKFVKPYWKWAVAAPFLMLLEVAMDLMQPRLIQRIVDHLNAHMPEPGVLTMIALGGDMRFAANEIVSDWNQDSLAWLPLATPRGPRTPRRSSPIRRG